MRALIQHEMPYWWPLLGLLDDHTEEAKESGDKELQEIAEWEHKIFKFILEISELREEERPHLARPLICSCLMRK